MGVFFVCTNVCMNILCLSSEMCRAACLDWSRSIKIHLKDLAAQANFRETLSFKSKNINSHAIGMQSWVQMGIKSILRETLFLDQLHNFSLVSFNSFLHSFLKSELLKKFFVTKIMSFLKVDSHKSRKTLLIIFTLGLERVKNLFLNGKNRSNSRFSRILFRFPD